MTAAEMLTVTVIAAALAFAWALLTVTPADCSGLDAQPGIGSWLGAALIAAIGPAFGAYRTSSTALNASRRTAIVLAGAAFSCLFVVVGFVFGASLIDCA